MTYLNLSQNFEVKEKDWFKKKSKNKMDKFYYLSWDDCLQEGAKPKNLDSLLETTIVVWNSNTNEIWTRHRGLE